MEQREGAGLQKRKTKEDPPRDDDIMSMCLISAFSKQTRHRKPTLRFAWAAVQ